MFELEAKLMWDVANKFRLRLLSLSLPLFLSGNALTAKSEPQQQSQLPQQSELRHSSSGRTEKLGWLLTMQLESYGQLKWYVSDQGMKLISPMVYIVMKPPAYTPIMFNKASKKYMLADNRTLKRIRNFARSSEGSGQIVKQSGWTMVAQEKLCNLDTIHYRRHMLNPRHSGDLTESMVDDLWVIKPLPDLGASTKRYCEPLVLVFDLDAPGGLLPVRAVSIWKAYKAGREIKVDTRVNVDIKRAQRTRIEPNEFDLPKGLRKVDSYTELL